MINRSDLENFWTRGNIHARIHKALSEACLNDKKLERNSFKVHVFGFPSTIAKVLKPKELSI